MQKEIKITFQIDRKRIFEVSYYTLGGNKSPYFSTSAAVFNQPKTDFNRCGQAQESVLCGKGGEYPESKPAADFFRKWDKKHLSVLTDSELADLLNDVEKLKAIYNWCDGDNFADQRKLSKMPVKNTDDLPETDAFAGIAGSAISSHINKDGASVYLVRLINTETGARVSQTYRMGSGHKGRKPELFEVLGSMVSDAQAWKNTNGSVKAFAQEFGFDDPRQAIKIFDECERVANKLDTLGIDWQNMEM